MAPFKFKEMRFAYSLIAFVVFGILGCATSHRYILVSVVDSKTGAPVQGATVSIWLHPQIRTITDSNGMALLKLRLKDAHEVGFNLCISNQQYNWNVGEGPDSNNEWRWLKRGEGVVPTEPDTVIDIESRAEERREEEAKARAFNSAKRAAEKLLKETPDAWPERTNAVIEILYSERWDRASKVALGSKEDIASIGSVVIRDMRASHGKVEEIRWISPEVVMVRAECFDPSSSYGAGFTYVLRKGESGWTIVTRAVDGVT